VGLFEAGTEAAAATLFEARTKSMAGRFNADHPFLFLIWDHGSGTILFMGRLVDPRA
jgi:serine protease inhibitor